MKAPGSKENYRVVIEPRRLGDFGGASMSLGLLYGRGPDAQKRIEKDMEARCSEMISDIKRHIDNVGSVHIDFDQEYVCEHCGAGWTEKSSTYNGGCCDKDEENAPPGDEDAA